MKLTFRKKLVLLITLCSFICTVLIGGTCFFTSNGILIKKSKAELQLITNNEAKTFNSMFSNIETSVNFITNTTLSDFDVEKAKVDPSYLKAYMDKIEPITKKFSETTDGTMGVYIALNPDLFGVKQGIWYADVKDNGIFEKQEMTNIKDYTEEDVEHVGWYYRPIKAKKGLWLEPYLNKNINLMMISYVNPIYIDGTLIGVAGMDINFDIFKNALSNV